jgi:diguanylate cyclase (GGDEF)-like protein
MSDAAGRAAAAAVARSQLLLQAAETINSSLDSLALEQTILGEAARLMGADAAALLLLRGDVLVAGEALGLDERARDGLVVPVETSVYGRALVSGEVVLEQTSESAPDSPPAGVALTGGQWRTVVASPLRSNRTTYGALGLFFRAPRSFADEELALLRTLALQAAIALDNRRLMQEKERMAVHDGLTDVYNRGYLELAIDRAVKEVDRRGGDLSVLFVDVDGMKDVNDTYGHQAGDALLVDLARLLAASCRASDVVARYGGDEFVVLMSGTDADGAEAVARKVAAAIAERNAAAPPPDLSASVGTHTAGAGTAGDLLREADRKMYAVKRARGGRRAHGGRGGAAES